MTMKGCILILTLVILFSSSPPQTYAAYSYSEPIIEIKQSVSFREIPSTSGRRIRYLKSGEQLEIINKPNRYWYEARDSSGTIGFLSSSSTYIQLTTKLIFPEPNGEAISSVSFRTGPTTSSNRIRYLAKGEKFWVLEKTNDYWYKITDRNDVIGYVSSGAKYITTTFVDVQKTIEDPIAALELVISAGLRYLGTPYEYGSSRFDTSTFDCSDFIRQIFLDGVGLMLPSDSRQQAEWVKQNAGGQAIVDWQLLNRGDLMFFMSYKGYDAEAYTSVNKSTEVVTHVGIYLGNGQVLHTYSADAGGVVISDVNGTNWAKRFLYGGQAL